MSSELKAPKHEGEIVNRDQESRFSRHPRIYPVTEGIQSAQTADVYERYFNHFLDHIKIHDLQALLNFSLKVIKQMLIDYILYLRDDNLFMTWQSLIWLTTISSQDLTQEFLKFIKISEECEMDRAILEAVVYKDIAEEIHTALKKFDNVATW
jgi:hypothetical protein